MLETGWDPRPLQSLVCLPISVRPQPEPPEEPESHFHTCAWGSWARQTGAGVSRSSAPERLPSSPFSTALPHSQEHRVLKRNPFPPENVLASGLPVPPVMVSVLCWQGALPPVLGLLFNRKPCTTRVFHTSWLSRVESRYTPQVPGLEGHLGGRPWGRSQRFASGSEPPSCGLVTGPRSHTPPRLRQTAHGGPASLSTSIPHGFSAGLAHSLRCFPPHPQVSASQSGS